MSDKAQQQKDQRKDEIAQEKFGKPFDECEPTERQSVGGTLGGETRKEQMAQEHGGGEEGVHKAYAEMGASGGKKGTQE